MVESLKKPWVKMPADEAKELLLLRARVLEIAQQELIYFQDRPLVDVLEDIISDKCADAYNNGLAFVG